MMLEVDIFADWAKNTKFCTTNVSYMHYGTIKFADPVPLSCEPYYLQNAKIAESMYATLLKKSLGELCTSPLIISVLTHNGVCDELP